MNRTNKKNIIFGVILFYIMAFVACGNNSIGEEALQMLHPTFAVSPTPIVVPTNTPAPEAEITIVPTDPPALESTDTSAPTLVPTSTPTSTPIPDSTLPAELSTLMEQAERMAAGYDYLGAIELLQGCEGYEKYQDVLQRIQHFEELDSQLVLQTKEQLNHVPHIFFHSLIVDTDRAFDGDGDSSGYDMNMTTIDEFNKMMQQMYERGYVLVSPYDIAYEVTDEDGTRMVLGDIRLPEGKKPFILSQDDVNYYSYMIGSGDGKGKIPAVIDSKGDGFATKLVIDEKGKLACEYVDMDGNVSIGAYDMVPHQEGTPNER